MKFLAAVCAFTLFLGSRAADFMSAMNTRFEFAGVEQARHVLTNRDDFVIRLSPFDRAARLKTSADVSESQFLAFVATNILAFEPSEISLIKRGLAKLKPNLHALKVNWPESIQFIKTTGREEGDAAYTRANAIVFPRSKLRPGGSESIEDLIAHEIFHVLSRHDSTVKEKLYGAIGFHKCDELVFPPSLVRITNPDAPRNDHWIALTTNGKTVPAIPILFADPARYDIKRGGEFFSYLQFKFLVVQTNGATAIKYDTAKPILLDPAQAEGFFTQVGQNTQYIIHPEEILAENFKLLVTGNKKVRSPEILSEMKSILNSPGQ
ncbi:MAG TPA: hypothetical protein VM680_05180 [Verrucomicrobiae bacterium]|nr:hypothetical protein [Verrucomicrobiae bacterium]